MPRCHWLGVSRRPTGPGRRRIPRCGPEMFAAYRSGFDNFDEPRLVAEYEKAAAFAGCTFEAGPGRTMFMDTYAVQAAVHMARHGTTQAQIAAGRGQEPRLRRPEPAGAVPLPHDDRGRARRPAGVVPPHPRHVRADRRRRGRGDRVLDRLPPRASRCRAGPGRQGAGDRPHRRLLPGARRAVAVPRGRPAGPTPSPGIGPADVDVAEVHDATSFCEIHQVEMLGFCPIGEGGAFVASGATGPGGTIPINTGGRAGLEGSPGRGHGPVDDLRAGHTAPG